MVKEIGLAKLTQLSREIQAVWGQALDFTLLPSHVAAFLLFPRILCHGSTHHAIHSQWKCNVKRLLKGVAPRMGILVPTSTLTWDCGPPLWTPPASEALELTLPSKYSFSEPHSNERLWITVPIHYAFSFGLCPCPKRKLPTFRQQSDLKKKMPSETNCQWSIQNSAALRQTAQFDQLEPEDKSISLPFVGSRSLGGRSRRWLFLW